jgi:PAS domain-containing protein
MTLRYLFDAIPDILCLTDFKGRFLKIKAGCELLGYTEEEICIIILKLFILMILIDHLMK